MKVRLFLTGLLLVLPLTALAEGTEEVNPHIFSDLNGNGISDLEEGMSPGTNPNDTGMDVVELPPTPEEEVP